MQVKYLNINLDKSSARLESGTSLHSLTTKKLIEFPGASPITAPVGDGELPASNNPVKKNNAARTLVLSI